MVAAVTKVSAVALIAVLQLHQLFCGAIQIQASGTLESQRQQKEISHLQNEHHAQLSQTEEMKQFVEELHVQLPEEQQALTSGFIASSVANDPSSISEEATVVRKNREANDDALRRLEGQTPAVDAAMRAAKSQETDLWTKAKASSKARQDAETRATVATVKWDDQIRELDGTLEAAATHARIESGDRKSAEDLAVMAERTKAAQEADAAEAIGEAGNAEAFADGAAAQRAADQPTLDAMGQALKAITSISQVGAQTQAKMNGASMEAGKRIGTLASGYAPNSRAAETISKAMSKLSFYTQALQAQEAAAAKVVSSGVVS